ncbi:MAG: isochorismatase family protein [Chloroflexota bacterium]
MQKETYFTPETIHTKTGEFLAEVAHFRRHHPAFVPSSAALLVLDMQRYFLDPASHAFVPSAPAIVSGIERLVAAFEAAQHSIIFTRHANTEADAGRMSTWWRDLLKPGTADSQIVITSPSAQIIPKTQYDAFFETTLDDLLKARQVRQVVITGVMTHLCCETTARSAFVRGYEVFFTVDGTATYTEAFHRASLLNLAHGFAVPVRVGEMLAEIEHEF